jgi:hypothetical protein
MRYDPISDSWARTGALAVGRWAFAVAVLADGRVLAAGGRVLSGPAKPDPAADVLTATSEVFTL